MKLRSKLALAFGSVFIVAVAASLLLTETLARSSSALVRVASENMPTYAGLGRLKEVHAASARTVREGLAQDPEAALRKLEMRRVEMELVHDSLAQLLAAQHVSGDGAASLEKTAADVQAAGRKAFERGRSVLMLARKDPASARDELADRFRPQTQQAQLLVEVLQAQVGRRLALEFEGLRGAAHRRARLVGSVVPLILLLFVMVTYALGRHLTERVGALHETADRIAAGDLSARTALRGNDELACLGRTFDRMAATVQRQTETLRAYSEELEQRVADRTRELAEKARELARRNEALAQANEQLLSLDTMKDEFVSVVSHELRTPLMAMQGALALIDSGETEEEDLHEFIELCQRNTNRLILLVEDLLDLSQLDEGQLRLAPERFRLGPVVDDALKGLGMMAREKGVTLASRVPTGLEVYADPRRTAQVLVNLVSNGIKFAPNGSVTVDAEVNGRTVEVGVADTGIGIPGGELDRIFDRFSQVDNALVRKTGGVGLGLNIARTLVERQGGALTVESTMGEGSTFRFTLPAASVLDAEPAAAGAGRGDRQA